jgi:hypothetical protein
MRAAPSGSNRVARPWPRVVRTVNEALVDYQELGPRQYRLSKLRYSNHRCKGKYSWFCMLSTTQNDQIHVSTWKSGLAGLPQFHPCGQSLGRFVTAAVWNGCSSSIRRRSARTRRSANAACSTTLQQFQSRGLFRVPPKSGCSSVKASRIRLRLREIHHDG